MWAISIHHKFSWTVLYCTIKRSTFSFPQTLLDLSLTPLIGEGGAGLTAVFSSASWPGKSALGSLYPLGSPRTPGSAEGQHGFL